MTGVAPPGHPPCEPRPRTQRPPLPGGRVGYRGGVVPVALRNGAYGRLFAAQSIAQFGGMLTYLSLPLAAYASTGSASTFATVFMASNVGIMLTMLLGGAFADRFDRQRMMLASDAAGMVIVAALGVAVITESWGLAAACAFVQTTVASLLRAGAALQRDIVPDEHRVQANALTNAAMNGSQLLAPIVGMAIFVQWGFLPIVIADVATSIVSFSLLLGVRDPRGRAAGARADVKAAVRRTLGDVADGARALVGDRWLRCQLPGNVVSGLMNGMFIVIVIPWIDHALELPPSAFGVMLAIIGGSGVVAAVLVAKLADAVAPATLITAGGLLGILGSAVFVVPVPLPLLGAGLMMFGSCNVALGVGTATARHRRFRGDLQGRLASLEMVGGQLWSLAGMGLALVLVDRIEPAVLMSAFGVGVALGCMGDILAARVLAREPIVARDAGVADSELVVSG